MVVRDAAVVAVLPAAAMVVLPEVDRPVKEVEAVDGKDGVLVTTDYDVKWRC